MIDQAGEVRTGTVRISPSARRALRALVASRGRVGEALWIRGDDEGGHDLALVDRCELDAGTWTVLESDPLPLAWPTDSGDRLDGALVDHREGGFEVRLAPGCDEDLAAELRVALEDGVNPLVASHGGRVRLVGVEGGRVRVRMEGGCQGCTSARETLAGVVRRHLEHAVPGVRSVIDVTDHEAGEAPWFGKGRGTSLPVLPDAFLREACG